MGGKEKREYEGGILLFLNPNSRIHAGRRSTQEHTHMYPLCSSHKMYTLKDYTYKDMHTKRYTALEKKIYVSPQKNYQNINLINGK